MQVSSSSRDTSHLVSLPALLARKPRWALGALHGGQARSGGEKRVHLEEEGREEEGHTHFISCFPVLPWGTGVSDQTTRSSLSHVSTLPLLSSLTLQHEEDSVNGCRGGEGL